MATADLYFNIKINGTPDEITSILEIMFEYSEGKDGVYFSLTRVNAGDKEFSLNCSRKDEILSAAHNSGDVKINSLGPFGRYGELDEVDIFREMAQAAPNAAFTASISGFAGYADQSLHASLANGLLHVSTSYLSDDCRGDGEFEYFTTNLPYDKFINLFRLDGEEFDEEMYDEFMADNFCCYDSIGEFFEETDYKEFIELLDAESPLTEDEYGEITEQFMDMDCEICSEYLEREGFVDCKTYTYDPVEKKYLNNASPKMKTGVAYSINDDIREYLDSIGHPSDDETIAALSVEDVYAILAGTYGKDDSADGDDQSDADEYAEDEEIPEDCAEEESDEDDSYEQDAVKQKAGAEDVVSEVVTTDTAGTEPETSAEAECKSPSKKKSFPVWLIVLLIAIILISIAVYVFSFGEKIFAYIADLLGIAARLL